MPTSVPQSPPSPSWRARIQAFLCLFLPFAALDGAVIVLTVVLLHPGRAPDALFFHVCAASLGVLAAACFIMASLRLRNEAARRHLERSTEALRKLSQAVEQNPASIVVTDLEGTIEYVNPQFTRVTGYGREEVIGRNPRVLKSGSQSRAYYRSMWETIGRGETWQGEFENVRKDGTIYWENALIAPILGETGAPTHYLAIKSDVTSLKTAQEALKRSERLYALAQHAAHIGAWEMNLATGEIVWSDQIEPMIGMTPGSFDGRLETFLKCIPEEDRERIANYVERLRSSRDEAGIVHRIRRPDGEERWMSVRGASFCDEEGETVRLSGVVWDVTERHETQERLRRFRFALDHSADSVYLVDAERERFVDVNATACEALGMTRERILASNPLEVLPFVKDEDPRELFRRIRSGERTAVFTGFQSRQDGESFAVEASLRAPQEEEAPLIVAIVRDVSARLRAEERLRWQAAVDAAVAGLSRVLMQTAALEDVSHVVLEIAKNLTQSAFGFTGFFDQDTGELVCPTLTREIWPEAPISEEGVVRFNRFGGLWGWVLEHRSNLLTNAPKTDPRSSGVPEGHMPIQRFISAPAMIGDHLVGQIALANASRDYTERDLELVERLAGLYALAVQRRRGEIALQRARDAAEEASRAKSRFLSTMSHELRTPMNAVLGFSELLKNQYFGPLNEKQRKYVDQIEASGRHLLELINELLDLAKIDAGAVEINLQTFDPAKLVRNMAGMLEAQFSHRGVESALRIAPGLGHAVADERKYRQVLLNLIANALKFTPDGGRVEVVLSRTQQGDLRTAVRDNGPGVPDSDKERIFSEFYQSDRTRDEQLGGTGIGLALCRRIVTLHGGVIGVKDAEAGGSEFWFIIPQRTAEKRGLCKDLETGREAPREAETPGACPDRSETS